MVNKIAKLDPKIIEKIDCLPKVNCPIFHYFAPGIYLREMRIPKGTIAVGHYHKEKHFCLLVKGVAVFFKQDKKPEMLTAPVTFVANPGHKIVFAATDIIVQNIHPNPDNIMNQDELERMFIDQSDYFNTFYQTDKNVLDHEDFKALSYKPIETDLYLNLPIGFKTVLSIRDSNIHGKGIFSSCPWSQGQYIGPFKMEGEFTELAKFINHSVDPNAMLHKISNDEIILVAIKNINGCKGDSKGEEITINYRGLVLCHGELSRAQPSLRSAD